MGGVVGALLPMFGKIGERIAGKFFPDPGDELKRLELSQAIPMAIIENAAELERLGGEIVKTEAASSHWLAANWRPLTMLIFVALIVARWLGFAAPDLAPEEYIKLWDIVELGLGGYVIGRSAEKIVPAITKAMRK